MAGGAQIINYYRHLLLEHVSWLQYNLSHPTCPLSSIPSAHSDHAMALQVLVARQQLRAHAEGQWPILHTCDSTRPCPGSQQGQGPTTAPAEDQNMCA